MIQYDTVIHSDTSSQCVSRFSHFTFGSQARKAGSGNLRIEVAHEAAKAQLHLHLIFLYCLLFALIFCHLHSLNSSQTKHSFWFHDPCSTFHLAAELQVANRKTTKLIMVRTRSKKKDRLALAKHGKAKAWQSIAAQGSTDDLSKTH